MDFNIILGGIMIVYGIITLVMRIVAPDRLWKLEPMKKQWGEKSGVIIHIVAYTMLPLVLGMLLMIRALV